MTTPKNAVQHSLNLEPFVNCTTPKSEQSARRYHLGLDLGTNSIGWAAVLVDSVQQPYGLLDMGVRIFPDGRDAKSKSSNAVARREGRSKRRRRERYLMRRRVLLSALVDCGLAPDSKSERKRLETLGPYGLRARALDQPLEPYELGRALFHINQRRGFKSNRKAIRADQTEESQMLDDISALRRSITEADARTLGEYLARQSLKGHPVRARAAQGLYPDRVMYETEFDTIRRVQEPHHNLDAGQWDNMRRIIFYQRPLEPVTPGWCLFEYHNGERRAAKALPLFQEYRMLQEVNNLRIRVGTDPERPLDANERARAMRRLRSGKDITLSIGRDSKPATPTRDLGLPSGATFNLAAGGRMAVKGDETTALLSKPERFGKQWSALPLYERNAIVKFLLDTEEPEAVRAEAATEWGLNAAQAEAIAKVALTPGYGNLSEKAIRKILPHLERGVIYSEAVRTAGYAHHSDFRNDEAHNALPYYGVALPRDVVGADPKKDPELNGDPARFGRIANPTVHIGLNQLRRLVNRLIEIYGKPEEIVVELARELKSNREQNLEQVRRQKTGRERNQRFREQLESAEMAVTANALLKLRLWEEQGPPHAHVCPYTDQTLSFEMIMTEQTEVDHILPFSRTLDDSVGNKVVCLAGANRFKGNRTPYEAFGSNPADYKYDRILAVTANFPANKRWRFQPNAMERFEGERDFLDRQLNETQYLSRTARAYLACLYDEKGEGHQRVRVIPGHMTALLRRGWGLDGMLDGSEKDEMPRKTRDDHRHHAIDAFVVANTTQGLLRRFAQAAGSDYSGATKNLAKLIPPPWKEFDRSLVQEFLDKIVVSYKQDHGTRNVREQTTGQLHEAMAYGLVEELSAGQHKVVLRKDLSKFSAKDLDLVRDVPLQDALRQLWNEVDGLPSTFAERAAREGVLVNGRRQKVRRARLISEAQVIPIRHQDEQGRVHQKGYKPGGNEFAVIWQLPDGTWHTVVVSTFNANQPGFSIADCRPHPAAKKLMQLQINDLGALGEGANRRIVRVRKMDNAKIGPRIVLDDHNEANVADRIKQDTRIRKETNSSGGMKEDVHSAEKLRRLGFRKVRVDELGNVYDPGPYKP